MKQQNLCWKDRCQLDGFTYWDTHSKSVSPQYEHGPIKTYHVPNWQTTNTNYVYSIIFHRTKSLSSSAQDPEGISTKDQKKDRRTLGTLSVK